MERGRRVTIKLDGKPIEAYEGETVASALLASGHFVLRYTQAGGKPRGIYCGIGLCYECRVTVDGAAAQRACLVPVREGMHIRTGERRP